VRPIDVARKLCPKAKPSYLAAIEHGDALFKAYDITTPARLAHFFAQIMHESGGLAIEWESGAYSAKRLSEIFGWNEEKQKWNHSARVTDAEAQQIAQNGKLIFERVYGLGNPGKAKELGNTKPGDGYRYRGGGLMQTTGRYNYRTIGEKCGVDFEGHPELVLSAQHALKPALSEWAAGQLNKFADQDDILSISRKINLGNTKSTSMPNGMPDRRSWLAKLKRTITVVDLTGPSTPPPLPELPPSPPTPPPIAPTSTAKKFGIGSLIAAGVVAVVVFFRDHPVVVVSGVAACIGIFALIRHFRKKP